MPSFIELHDSTIRALERRRASIQLRLDAYVHRWTVAAGRWLGSGLVQPTIVTIDGTYATLRIFSEYTAPEAISATLGIVPTSSFRMGEAFSPRVPWPRPSHGWLLCTKGLVDSKDTRRHIDWLLDKVLPVAPAFARVTKGGTWLTFRIWVSARGQGGPMLSPWQMQRLALLGLECSFDVYFRGEEEHGAG